MEGTTLDVEVGENVSLVPATDQPQNLPQNPLVQCALVDIYQ